MSEPVWAPYAAFGAATVDGTATWTTIAELIPSAVGPTLDLDLTNPASASQLTCTRASVAYHDDAAGVWSSFAPNVPRVTSRGLIVEPTAAINSIRNNSMQGAAISPSTLPTFWSIINVPGMTLSVVGTGVENGVDYIDLRFVGSTIGGFWIAFDGAQQIASANGQTWAGSLFCKMVAGNPNQFNVTPPYFAWQINDASGNGIDEVGGTAPIPLTVGGPLTRVHTQGTIGTALGVYVQAFIYAEYNGTSIDCTIRLGWPQLENVTGWNQMPTTPIRTTNTAVTRAAETVEMLNIGSWYGTVSHPSTALFEGVVDYPTLTLWGEAGKFFFNTVNVWDSEFSFDRTKFYFDVTNGAGSYVTGTTVNLANLAKYKIATAWAAGDAQFYVNGVPAPHLTPPLPSHNGLHLGDYYGSGSSGAIKRIKFWQRRLSDSELQAATELPSLDLDLTNPATASQLTCQRSTVGYHDNLAGVWSSFPINTPRITDRGLRVEMARTNSIRNNSMQGAVVGTLGSGGALPTNWVVRNATGFTISVVAVGVENGIDYIDIRLVNSIPAVIFLCFEGNTQIVSANGQTWVGSTFTKTVAGDITLFGGDPLYVSWCVNDVSGNYLGETSNGTFYISPTIGAPLARTASWDTIATAAGVRVQPFLWGVAPVPLDVTIRIGWPQLEQVADYTNTVATSPIRTTNAAVTRGYDYIEVANFSSWYAAGPGSMHFEGRINDGLGFSNMASFIGHPLNNTGDDNAEFAFAGNAFWFYLADGNVAQATQGIPGANPGQFKIAAAWGLNDVRSYANGNSGGHDTSATMPTFQFMQLSHDFYGLHGTITRFAYWQSRISDQSLQALTGTPVVRGYVEGDDPHARFNKEIVAPGFYVLDGSGGGVPFSRLQLGH